MISLPDRSRVGTLLAAATFLVAYPGAGERPKQFKSPDATLTAVVTLADKQKGLEKYESRISILRSGGVQISSQDFSSEDGEHGYGVDRAQWTYDSRYFICRMRNSGGHSPMYAPVVFWSRKSNHFYQLNDCTADRTFSITRPDQVSVDTWPGLNPATVSLDGLRADQVTELR